MREDVLVVDASIAVKWYQDEEGSDRAQAVLDSNKLLFAPDILPLEVLHVLTKNVRRNVLPPESALAALRDLPQAVSLLIASQTLLPRALEIALELRHSIHDCLYLAAAQRWDAAFLTSDRIMIRKFAGTESAPFLLDLNEVPS